MSDPSVLPDLKQDSKDIRRDSLNVCGDRLFGMRVREQQKQQVAPQVRMGIEALSSNWRFALFRVPTSRTCTRIARNWEIPKSGKRQEGMGLLGERG